MLCLETGVKPALWEAESRSWPSRWMMVCPQTSFAYTSPKSALNSERAAFFPSYLELTSSCVVPYSLWQS